MTILSNIRSFFGGLIHANARSACHIERALKSSRE